MTIDELYASVEKLSVSEAHLLFPGAIPTYLGDTDELIDRAYGIGQDDELYQFIGLDDKVPGDSFQWVEATKWVKSKFAGKYWRTVDTA